MENSFYYEIKLIQVLKGIFKSTKTNITENIKISQTYEKKVSIFDENFTFWQKNPIFNDNFKTIFFDESLNFWWK